MGVYIDGLNRIVDGGLESGTLDNWNVVGTGIYINGYDSHSGIYHVAMQDGGDYIEQSINDIHTSSIAEFYLWKKGSFSFSPVGGTSSTIRIYYTDGTTTDINHTTVLDENDIWVKIDIVPYLYSNKFINKIRIIFNHTFTQHIDDITLNEYLPVISWEESQECIPAMRDIPTSSNGSYVDVGTFKLKARILNMTVRLTSDMKTAFQNILDENTSIILYGQIDGDSYLWTYDAWLTKKPLIYEYSKDNVEREWRADLEFKIRSFSYSGSGYTESEVVITIDGNNYNHIIDTMFSETNEVFEPEYLNQGTVTLDENVWNRTPLYVSYVIRTSSLGRWKLDQILLAHTLVNLTDAKYGLNNNVWLKNIRIRWTGNVNWENPWEIEVNIIGVPSS